MNLGTKTKNFPATVEPLKNAKEKVVYPTLTIEKPVGNHKFGDRFTATVEFRVMNVEHGKSYTGAEPKHRCTLEVLSINPDKPKGKGLPH